MFPQCCYSIIQSTVHPPRKALFTQGRGSESYHPPFAHTTMLAATALHGGESGIPLSSGGDSETGINNGANTAKTIIGIHIIKKNSL